MKHHLSLIMSLIALALSVWALAWSHPSDPSRLRFDYLGLIVGMLAILVTALVAWQIYTVIDMKESMKQQKAYIRGAIDAQELAIARLDAEYNSRNKGLDDKINFGEVYKLYDLAKSFEALNDYRSAFKNYLSALIKYDLSNEMPEAVELYKKIKEAFKSSKERIPDLIETWGPLNDEKFEILFNEMSRHNDSELFEWLYELKRQYSMRHHPGSPDPASGQSSSPPPSSHHP